MKVSVKDFAAIMTAQTSTLAAMNTTTAIKVNKKSRISGIKFEDGFKGEVFKAATIVANVGISYENTVNNRLVREEKENNFSAEALPWGQFWNDSKVIVEHKGELYLRYYPEMNAAAKHDKSTLIYADGTPLTSEEVALLAEYTAAPSTSSRQGLDNEVKVRTIKIANINSFKTNGTTYEIA